MIQISILCADCGRKLMRLVDEECPPSHFRCRCGAQFQLDVEPLEDDSLPVGENGGEAIDYSGSLGSLVGST